MKTKLILVLCAVLTVCLLFATGCEGAADAGAPDKEASSLRNTARSADDTDNKEPVITLDDKSIVVVVDASGSTDISFAESVRAALADQVAGYIPPKPEETRRGVEAIPGLRLLIYLVVTGNANEYNNKTNHKNHLLVEIPGTPSLPALNAVKPEIPADGVSEEYQKSYMQYKDVVDAWEIEEQAWSNAYDKSLADCTDMSETIRTMNLVFDTSGNVSGIQNTICAALGAMPDDAVNMGIFSDLIENGTAGSIPPSGKDGLVALCVPAPDGDSKAADARAAALSQTMVGWGFDEANMFAPALAENAIDFLFENQEVTEK